MTQINADVRNLKYFQFDHYRLIINYTTTIFLVLKIVNIVIHLFYLSL